MLYIGPKDNSANLRFVPGSLTWFL